MSKFNDFMLQWGVDKFLHFMGGAAVFAITESWIILIIVSFGKELYDKCCELCLILFKKSWFKIRDEKLKPIDQKSGDYKTYYRKELFENNLIDLDKNTSIRDFVFKSISQDFSPGFNFKIKYNGKLYNYRSIIDPIKEED